MTNLCFEGPSQYFMNTFKSCVCSFWVCLDRVILRNEIMF